MRVCDINEEMKESNWNVVPCCLFENDLIALLARRSRDPMVVVGCDELVSRSCRMTVFVNAGHYYHFLILD
jgi:hypothetical protein